jgi:hypothetical protein
VSRAPPPVSPAAAALEALLAGCCCTGAPQLQWRREAAEAALAADVAAQQQRAEAKAAAAAAAARAAAAPWPLEEVAQGASGDDEKAARSPRLTRRDGFAGGQGAFTQGGGSSGSSGPPSWGDGVGDDDVNPRSTEGPFGHAADPDLYEEEPLSPKPESLTESFRRSKALLQSHSRGELLQTTFSGGGSSMGRQSRKGDPHGVSVVLAHTVQLLSLPLALASMF